MVFRSWRSTRTALYFSFLAVMAASVYVSMQPARPLAAAALAPSPTQAAVSGNLPRTADGKPNLAGIWKVSNKAANDLLDQTSTPGKSVVEGNQIPYDHKWQMINDK